MVHPRYVKRIYVPHVYTQDTNKRNTFVTSQPFSHSIRQKIYQKKKKKEKEISLIPIKERFTETNPLEWHKDSPTMLYINSFYSLDLFIDF